MKLQIFLFFRINNDVSTLNPPEIFPLKSLEDITSFENDERKQQQMVNISKFIR